MTGFRFILPLLAVFVSLALQPACAKEGAMFRAIVVGVTDYRGGLESKPPLNLDEAARLMRDAIRNIARGAKDALVAGGWLLLEHGYDQEQAVAGILSDAQYDTIASYKDASGIARVTEGRHSR